MKNASVSTEDVEYNKLLRVQIYQPIGLKGGFAASWLNWGNEPSFRGIVRLIEIVPISGSMIN